MGRPESAVFETPTELYEGACEIFLKCAQKAILARGLFSVVLAGGSTPKGVYLMLADPKKAFRDQIPWEKIHFFWGDERWVPKDHPDSNFRMADESLLSKVPVPASHLHPIAAGSGDPAQSAAQYEREIRHFFKVPSQDPPPHFDLIFLGVGAEGHTASLFPGLPALDEKKHWAVAVWVQKLNAHRITLTYPILNQAREIVFLVKGADKAEVVQKMRVQKMRVEKMREGASENLPLPAQRISPINGRLIWLLDREAASRSVVPAANQGRNP